MFADGDAQPPVTIMPSQDNIDVRIVCDGRPLTEYPDPENSTLGENHFRRYVEVRTGQHFGIQVNLIRGFNFEYAPFVYAQVELDDAEDCSCYTFPKSSLNHRRGTILSTQNYTFKEVNYKNDATGNWETFPYKFGALGMSKRP